MEASDIVKRLETELPGSQVEARDLKGTGDHFEVTVASTLFVGKSRLQSHRMVMDALSDWLKGPLHAIKINTKALES